MRAFVWTVALFAMTATSSYAYTPEPDKAPYKASASYLGLGVSEIDAERAKALKLRAERGVEITRIEDDGPAAKAGVKLGDVLLEYNGQTVEGTEQLLRLVRETPAGREVKVSISRGGAIQNLTIRTGVRKLAVAKVGEPMRIEIPNFEIPDFNIPDVPRSTITWRSAALGVEAESLSGQLADYFGVKEGVLVRSVAKDTAADKAGIKAGDVITRVDGTPVTNPAEVTNALKLARGRSVGLQIVRERRELSLSITVGE